MFKDQTSPDTPSITFSVESEDGRSPSNSPVGLQLGLFGREAAPASPSPAPEQAKPKRTPATYGRSGFGSSESAALNQSLGSKLQQRLDGVGSMEYRQTWKQKATPSGRLYWEHIASALPIDDSDSTWWPTPQAADADKIGGTANYGQQGLNNHPGIRGNPDRPPMKKSRADDGQSTKPQVSDSGITPSSSSAPTGKRGALNPAFCLWLMGFPSDWLMVAPTKRRLGRKR